jgi:hypothetical protein
MTFLIERALWMNAHWWARLLDSGKEILLSKDGASRRAKVFLNMVGQSKCLR